ncbi:OmpA/MotB family protein [Caloramator sp. mosi_1]|uniref:OmpA/MotB family protein n=1 Tax=Caloramator sp. mosi_1 TaxID=3023090 RepID=UPI003FCC4E1E
MKKYTNEIIVEGHTDTVPINTGYYKSNWELSADRAVKVTRFLVESKGLDPKKFKL